MPNRFPRRALWQTKPPPAFRLNFAHPLANGVVLDLNFSEGGGTDSYDRSENGNAFAGGSVTWKTTDYGLTLTESSAGLLGTVPASTAWQVSPITLVWIGSLDVGPGGDRTLFHCEQNGTPSGWGFYRTTTDTQVRGYMRVGAAWSDPGPNSTITLGKMHHFCMTFDGATHKYYLDRSLIFSNSISGSVTYSATEPIQVGRDAGDVNVAQVSTGLIRIWNRALTDGEVYEHFANPWQIYQPATRIFQANTLASGNLMYPIPLDGMGTFYRGMH